MAIINESAARIAKELSSFSDYVEGSATASYNAQCAKAAAILEQVKPKCATADQRERAEWLYNRYCAVLAEAINRENEIGTRCPSVLICGPANFPVHKKEKQVAAWDANRENFRKAEHYLQMLKRAHTFAVKSDDPEVLDYLHAKLDQLQTAHQTMKDANAYYRKHKTLDDCPGITEKTRNWLENGHAFASGSPLSVYGCPFPSYELQNSNATIKRVKERIAQLEAAKAAQPVEDEHDGYTYRENTEAMRVQFLFDGKPDDETRTLLKRNGFKWARRRELGSASSTTMASMPLTASWRFWTASSKTDALTGLHRKAAPSQPARATPAASPGIYIPRPANLKTRISTGTSKCTSLWRYLHETQGNPHS